MCVGRVAAFTPLGHAHERRGSGDDQTRHLSQGGSMTRRATALRAGLARGLSAARQVDLVAWGAHVLGGEASGEVPSVSRAHGWLGRIAIVFAFLVALGPLVTCGTALSDAQDRTKGGSAFFVQYHRHEPFFLALMAVFAILVARLARRSTADGTVATSPSAYFADWHRVRLVGLAILIFGVTAAGTWGVMHRFPLAMDEYVAEFQARIFAAGRVTVPVPPEWRQFTPALRPTYVGIDPAGRFWTSSYWPVYSAIRALFVMAGAEAILNPLFAAASVVLVYACARRIWPNEQGRAWLAAIFLASSSQFLFMSMTAYAMPAHLCFSLLWLYAFSRGDRPGWIAAPIIGVAALGLHNPFPHALFVAPFLLQLVVRRRWGWTAYYAATYGAGIVLWIAWMQAFQAPLEGPIPAYQLFATPGLPMLFTQGLSVSLLLTWQTPLLAVLVIWSSLAWRSLSGTERCLIAGVALSLIFHTFLYTSQGHGWGYRYAYATLGNMALVGAAGVSLMGRALGQLPMRRLVGASVLLTICVQWPVRAWQIERHVRGFARLNDYIARLDADVVVIDPTTSWYGIDLIRNDPFLRRKPRVLSSFYLRPGDKHVLANRLGDRVHLLGTSEIAPFGIPTFPSERETLVWPPRPAHWPGRTEPADTSFARHASGIGNGRSTWRSGNSSYR
jgi:hypothetical protein